MAQPTEIFLDLQWDVVDECNGFGLDFGGSALKIVYLHKDDWQEPGERTTKTVRFRLLNFARAEFDEAMLYLKDRVCIRRKTGEDQPLIYTTGVGGSQYATQIRETFNVRTSNITELECHFAAFNYLIRNHTVGELIHELDQDNVQQAVIQARNANKLLGMITADSDSMKLEGDVKAAEVKFPQEMALDTDKKFTDFTDLFPCFMVMAGSNGGIFVVNQDETYGFANDMMRVGRMLLGVGSLLTGCKSYEELMSLAEKGNMRVIHEYLSDMKEGVDLTDDNYYSAYMNNEEKIDKAGFLFGKCVFKNISDFKKEDLALGFLHAMITDFVQNTVVPLRIHPEVKHVFFSGGYPNHTMMRNKIVTEWVDRELQAKSLFGKNDFTHTHFLKHGAHLGALGALLNQKLRFKVEKVTSS